MVDFKLGEETIYPALAICYISPLIFQGKMTPFMQKKIVSVGQFGIIDDISALKYSVGKEVVTI